MRLRIERDALVGALKTVLPAAGKTAVHALHGVRIDTGAGRVDFTTSNLDLTIKATIDGVDDDPGVAIVPASLLDRIARALPAGAVDLTTDDHQLHIVGGETVAQLRRIATEDWPRLPIIEVPADQRVTLGADAVTDLRHVAGMAHPDRAHASGAWGVQFKGGRAAATDSYRMIGAQLGSDIPEVIVPGTELATILRSVDGELTVAVDPRAVAFTAGNVTWTTTIVEAKYPDADTFLSQKPARRLTVPTGRFLEAIDRVTAVGSDATGDIVRLTVEGDKLIVSRTRRDVGSVTDTLSCDGDWVGTAGFNPTYLRSIVTALATHVDEIDLELELPENGCLMKPLVARSERMTVLLMPVRIPS